MERAIQDRPAKVDVEVRGRIVHAFCNPGVLEDFIAVHRYEVGASPKFPYWEAEARRKWPSFVRLFARMNQSDHIEIEITNNSKVPLHRPNIKIALNGPVYADNAIQNESPNAYSVLPRPPQLNTGSVSAQIAVAASDWAFQDFHMYREFDSIHYSSREDKAGVTLEMKLEDLRPGDPRLIRDELLLFTDDPNPYLSLGHGR